MYTSINIPYWCFNQNLVLFFSPVIVTLAFSSEKSQGSVLQNPGSYYESSLEKMEKSCISMRRLSHGERASKRIQRLGFYSSPAVGKQNSHN